jgi:hypothetical protein
VSHVLKLRDVIVGRCDLPDANGASKSLRAPFRPGLGWELVEPIFQLARSSNRERERYVKARDALALALYDKGGVLVETMRIDIVDDPNSPTRLTISAQLVNRE